MNTSYTYETIARQRLDETARQARTAHQRRETRHAPAGTSRSSPGRPATAPSGPARPEPLRAPTRPNPLTGRVEACPVQGFSP